MAKTEAHTYDEWNRLGYHIVKGKKATTINGKKVFSREQVERKFTKEDYARLNKVARTQYGKNYSAGFDWDDMNDMGEGGPFF